MSHQTCCLVAGVAVVLLGASPALSQERMDPPLHLSPAQRHAWNKVVAQKVEMRSLKGGGILAYFF
jgi:hypothetical protein